MLGLQQPHDERMSNIEFHTNDTHGTGACRKSVASGRCPVDQQRRPGRHPATAEQRQKRLGWSKEDNKRLFECYIRSEPERRGYRKRLLDLWKARNINNELTELTEQRLADQVRQIKNKKWLETVKQEEIAIRVRHEHQEIETTELHATDTLDYEHQETENTEPLSSDTPDHATTSATREEHQREEEPRVFTAEELLEEISPELETLCDRILEIIQLEQRIGLPSLKSCERTKLKAEVGKINETFKRIQTHNITELNSLMYAAAYVTAERMGMIKAGKGRRTEEPF